MFADLGKRWPQEFDDKEQCLTWISQKQLGINRSITLIKKDLDQLTIRTPITNENIRIVSEDPSEIAWLHIQMIRNNMYTIQRGGK